jgi:hypothetical protein
MSWPSREFKEQLVERAVDRVEAAEVAVGQQDGRAEAVLDRPEGERDVVARAAALGLVGQAFAGGGLGQKVVGQHPEAFALVFHQPGFEFFLDPGHVDAEQPAVEVVEREHQHFVLFGVSSSCGRHDHN